jgi:hypothetical protein
MILNLLSSHKLLNENLEDLYVITLNTDNNTYFFTPQDFNNASDQVVSFDNVKKEFCKTFNKDETLMFSVDTILYDKRNNRVVMVEFKSGTLTKHVKRRIKSKLKDSILLLNHLLNKDLNYMQENMEFVLVYNLDSNPDSQQNLSDSDPLDNDGFYELADELIGLAEEENIRFGLEAYEDIFVKKVHTYNVEQFKRYYSYYIA